VAGKVAKATTDFRTLADRQKTITARVEMGAVSAAVIRGSCRQAPTIPTRDIEVYENVVAIVETGGKPCANANRHVDPCWQHLEDDRPAGHWR